MARRETHPLTDTEIGEQLEAARVAYAHDRSAGLYASAARYDQEEQRIVMTLTSGYLIGIPVAALPHLANATSAQLAAVKVSASGMTLSIPGLDADYSVAALVLAMTAGEIGRRGGQSTSDAKAAASRANGARGGRPRKAS